MVFSIEVTQLVDDDGILDKRFPSRDCLKFFTVIYARNQDKHTETVLRGQKADIGSKPTLEIAYGMESDAHNLATVKYLLQTMLEDAR